MVSLLSIVLDITTNEDTNLPIESIKMCVPFRKGRLLLWHVGNLSPWEWPIQFERHRSESVHALDLHVLWHHTRCDRANSGPVFGFGGQLWSRKHSTIQFVEKAESSVENNGSDWRLE